MPNYNLPVNSALEELGITKTKKAVINLDEGNFNEEETFSWTRGELTTTIEIDPEFGRVKLGGLFGIGKGYAKKMPWDLFVANIKHWANEGSVMLEWTTEEDGTSYLHRAVSAEKVTLNRDNLLGEYLGNLPYLWRLRSLSSAGEVIYIDVELSDEDESLEGIRLVADLSLKTGLKLYSLLNLETDVVDGVRGWSPVVVSEAHKVKTRGKDTMEVYESLRAGAEALADDMASTGLGLKFLAGAEGEFFTYDYHSVDCLASLAQSKKYKLGTKTVGSKFPSETGNDTQVAEWVRMAILQDFSYLKPAEVHLFQTFFGDVIRLPSMVKTCSFCYSKLEDEVHE